MIHQLLSVYLIICHSSALSSGKEASTTVKVNGIVGQEVALPCNISPPTLDDEVALVLWYKDESSTPIYSLDARRGVVGHGKHSSSDNYATRTYFSTVSKPATLQLTAVTANDEGSYTCRVDFRKARTRYSEITLTIVVLPRKPRITDGKGDLIHKVAGPYNEGDRLVLLCESEGGNPLPSLTWWKESELIDESYEVTPQKITFNQLHVPPLHRNDLMVVFTCRASNNNISLPISSSVKIDLNLRPVQLEIDGAYEPLISGRLTELECRTSGSRPPAVITWWKENRKLKRTKNWTTHNGNISISTLTFQPSLEDSGKYLSCRAENPEIKESAIENGWKLEIHHAPLCRTGQKSVYGAARHETIKIFCDVEADPGDVKFYWRFNNTKEVLDITTFESKETRSKATFSPTGAADYGMVLCWGKNSIGTQKKPCLFHLVPAGPPSSVSNCSLQNQTEHSIELECSEGYDGGLSQHFVMEVHDTKLHKLRANLTSLESRFYVTGLPPGTDFVVIIYAVNAKGRSHAVILRTRTLTFLLKQSQEESLWQMTFSPVLIVLVAVVAGLVLLACLIVLGLKTRSKLHRSKDTKAVKADASDEHEVVNNKNINGVGETFKGWEPVESEKHPASVPLLLQVQTSSPTLSNPSETSETALYE
ncbi:nephrin-like isoform X5 [Limulus polyphemus]|uniref:Nephrin-like isoform X5 n=1 Tax=Limulus polyphemus TaxID=6850 RepID=A0ABM1SN71_LIMPO|nr:nephrin-like isoform X5 [Limulus polyphemus]